MPTSYTSKLMESGQTFQEFVMLCSRAMGACITMRDDNLDAPIPERFVPYPDYLKAIADSKRKLANLQAMTDAAKIEFGASKKAEAIDHLEKWRAKEIEEDRRLAEMKARVNRWTPPSSEHRGLKAFMLEQISVSKKDSVNHINSELATDRAKSPMHFYAEAVAKAKRSLADDEKSHAEEVECANSRTHWVQQLRESIKGK